jgi:hypothetical protein
MRQDVAFLASDALEGRMAGQPGAAKAAGHIREAFKKAGLKPPPCMAGHGQPFTFSPRMEVHSRIGEGGQSRQFVQLSSPHLTTGSQHVHPGECSNHRSI